MRKSQHGADYCSIGEVMFNYGLIFNRQSVVQLRIVVQLTNRKEQTQKGYRCGFILFEVQLWYAVLFYLKSSCVMTYRMQEVVNSHDGVMWYCNSHWSSGQMNGEKFNRMSQVRSSKFICYGVLWTPQLQYMRSWLIEWGLVNMHTYGINQSCYKDKGSSYKVSWQNITKGSDWS